MNELNIKNKLKPNNACSQTPLNLAVQSLAWLKLVGVKNIIICPGGRNAPFVEVLSKTKLFNVVTYFEERSASFYALGLAKKTNQPVVVITTSGTAVAETLPAVIEAHYQNTPLIVLTADRPKSYRGSGAPQAIDQANIFANFCRQIFDLQGHINELSTKTQVTGPLHINVCFDEPLLEGELNNYDDLIENYLSSESMAQVTNDSNSAATGARVSSSEALSEGQLNQQQALATRIGSKPLVILGALTQQQAQLILPVLKQINVPIYAEPHSQLKNEASLKNKLINTNTKSIFNLFSQNLCDSVIRIGGVPVLRFWRDLQNMQNIKVVNFTNNEYSGLARIKTKPLLLQQVQTLLTNTYDIDLALFNKYTAPRQLQTTNLNKEQTLVRSLSMHIKVNAHIYLGNSLPIREWDEVAEIKPDQIYTSMRGANGIDGNIAYFFGLCHSDRTNYCVIGDLTALYDLSSGFLSDQLVKNTDFKIIIINNSGGKIFDKLYANPSFQNNHSIDFKGWADMLKLDYLCVSNESEIEKISTASIIELKVGD